MYQNQGSSNPANIQIVDGMTVYAMDGTKLGKVHNYDPQAGYLEVRKGWLFTKDFFVPMSAVSGTDDEGITLRFSEAELSDSMYDAPPAMSTGGTTYGTSDTGYDTGNAFASASMAAEPRTTMVDDTSTTYAGDRDTTYAADRDTTYTSGRDATDIGTDRDIRVPVREEELVAGTEREEQGRVRVHKDVVTEEQTINVPLQRERVTVEHRAFSGDNVDSGDLFEKADIDVPVMGEKAVVGKRVRGVEEVSVHKDVVTDEDNVSDTVRKERVAIDGVDDVNATNTGRVGGSRGTLRQDDSDIRR